ncbi:sugar nucleotide-binding protein [Escherichia coli]|nr:sugar nucleotide-binding protein [Escherichia coli]MDC9043201.1 sugar nucleotide-binding protein [Escherichia coli]
MNILLFGKTGQVGWELQRATAPLGNLIALDVHSTDYCGDFSNPEGVGETVRSIRPDIIVNAAAHTAVDKAESEPEFAQLLNATSVEAIAKAANEVGAGLFTTLLTMYFREPVKYHGRSRMQPHR